LTFTAEAAPGVGAATDMYMLGPALGWSYAIPEKEDIFQQLKSIYQNTQRSIRRSGRSANKKISSYMNKLAEAASSQQQKTTEKIGETKAPDSEKPNESKPAEAIKTPGS
jgi:hypothetical protein